jgi:hypothetical protein
MYYSENYRGIRERESIGILNRSVAGESNTEGVARYVIGVPVAQWYLTNYIGTFLLYARPIGGGPFRVGARCAQQQKLVRKFSCFWNWANKMDR